MANTLWGSLQPGGPARLWITAPDCVDTTQSARRSPCLQPGDLLGLRWRESTWGRRWFTGLKACTSWICWPSSRTFWCNRGRWLSIAGWLPACLPSTPTRKSIMRIPCTSAMVRNRERLHLSIAGQHYSLVVFYPILLWFTYAWFIPANPVQVGPGPPKSVQVNPNSQVLPGSPKFSQVLPGN